MKYLYVKPVFLWLSAVVVMFLGACTSEVPGTSETAEAISFGVPQTRAAVETANDMDAFSVWGWYTDTETSGDPISVFDETRVDQASGWNYEGGTRYWIPGKTYSFYGVYPATLSTAKVNVSTDGTITITDFDCSATGEDAVDLMTAVPLQIYDGADASAVVMKFNHLLAKVNIMATVEGGNVTVTSVVFSGMATRGNYNSSTNEWNDTTQGNFSSSESKVLNSTGVDLLGDMLLIPQTITDNFKISVTYTIDDEEETKTAEIALPTANASNWEAGKSYRYTLAFKGNNIIFTVNVMPWNYSTGGIITVE